MNHAKKIAEILKATGGYIDGDYGYRLVTSQEICSGRWSRWDLVVIEDPDGGLWGYESEVGLTEYQEVDEPDEYEVFPVRAIPSTTYEKVK